MILIMTVWRVEEQTKLIMGVDTSNRFRLNVQ